MSMFKRFKRLPALVAAFSLAALAVAALAVADNLVADGDTLALPTIADNNMALGNVSCGATLTKSVPLAISRNGNNTNVFKDGAEVTVSVLSVTGSAVTATLPPATTITLPSDWGALDNNTRSDSVTSTVQITPTSSGSGSATVNYRATGLNTSNASINRDDTMLVSWTAGTCAPPNAAPTVPGAPALASGSSTPNQGVFGLDWTASTDDGLPSPPSVSYQLQHKDANDAGYSDVSGATALGTNSFAFTPPSPPEDEGTWTYQVRASDGTLQSAYSAASSEVKVDQSKPSAPTATKTPSSPAFGNWFKDSVTVSYSGSTDPNLADGSAGSGVASYTPASASQTFSTSGTHNYSGKATDNAGNESDATTGSVQVDATAPKLTLTCPTAPVILGSTASANWDATDGESGISGATSGSITLTDTSTVGTKTATAPAGTAKDNVLHDSAQETCQYSVVYDWAGFFQPIDNKDANGKYILNKAKAGSTVPVKFSLGGNQGLNIFFDSTYPQVSTTPCNADPNADLIEEYATATTSGLKYDSTVNPPVGQYIYNWKTDSKWSGQCRSLIVKLNDGTSHRADFNFFK